MAKTVLLLTHVVFGKQTVRPTWSTFSNIFDRSIRTDISLYSVGISLFPDIKFGTTLAIYRLFGKTPSLMHLFITIDEMSASILVIPWRAPEYHLIYMTFWGLIRWQILAGSTFFRCCAGSLVLIAEAKDFPPQIKKMVGLIDLILQVLWSRGVTRWGARGAQFPGRQFTMWPLDHCRGAELLLEAPKSPNSVTSTFFNTVNLPLKEIRFDHRSAKCRPWGRRFDQGGAEFVFWPWRHLISFRPCCEVLKDEKQSHQWKTIIAVEHVQNVAVIPWKPLIFQPRKGDWEEPLMVRDFWNIS